MRHWDSSI